MSEKPSLPEGGAKRRRENQESESPSEGGVEIDRREGEDKVPLNVISTADAMSVSSVLVTPQAVLGDGATLDEATAGEASEGPKIPIQHLPLPLPVSLLGSCVGAQAIMVSRLLLYQTAFQQQMAVNVALKSQLERAVQYRQVVDDMLRSQLQEAMSSQVTSAFENPQASASLSGVEGTAMSEQSATAPDEAPISMEQVLPFIMDIETPPTSSTTMATLQHDPSSSVYLDGDITELVLSTLGYSEDTIFTEQDEENERRAMTEEERTAALSDMRAMATHVCCPPRIMVLLLKPAFLALMSKEDRSRKKFHDVPESEILKSLSGYGILKDMLPPEMGGHVELDQTEWIAMRRAMELEEL